MATPVMKFNNEKSVHPEVTVEPVVHTAQPFLFSPPLHFRKNML